MKKNRELKIDEPCHMSWADLEGAGARRFCDQCTLHVVDGSSMTQSAAEKLVEESEERVCMRVEVDGQGRPVHTPETAAAGRVLSGIKWTLASSLLVACVDDGAKAPDHDDHNGHGSSNGSVIGVGTTEPPLERPLELMGEVCYPEETPGDLDPEGDAAQAAGALEKEKEVERQLLEKFEVMGAMAMHPIKEAPALLGECRGFFRAQA